MATREELERALNWARAQVGKPYLLGSFGSSFDCSTYMSGIATMIRDGQAARWFTTHPFHGGGQNPLPGWERDLEAPFMIGITDVDGGHTGGTLLGIHFEATASDGRRVRSSEVDPRTRGARHSLYKWVYGYRPSILDAEEEEEMAFPQGRDVSSWNEDNPSYTGFDFVVVKATEGTTYVNPKRSTQISKARNEGLVVGHYHFASGSGTVTQQVDHFLSVAPNRSDEFLVLDWESTSMSGSQKDSFLNLVRERRPEQRVLLYCNVDYWNNRQTSGNNGHGLWIAQWGVTPGSPAVTPWRLHQYTDSPYDKNVANFTSKSAMVTWVRALDATEPPPSSDPYANGLPQMDSDTPSAQFLQEELKRVGYFPQDVGTGAFYGTRTKESVFRFYEAQPDDQFPGFPAYRSEQIGPAGWAHLQTEPTGTYTIPGEEPPPEPDPPYVPPAYPGPYTLNSPTPSARSLQQALKDAGYMSASIAFSDNYGPATQAAVTDFYNRNPSLNFSGSLMGPNGWDLLHRQAYDNAPIPSGEAWQTVAEPAHNYTRVTYGSKTVNVRTRTMLERARTYITEFAWDSLPVNGLTQGSYNPGGVGASAGTHDGGGVVDIKVDTLSTNGRVIAVQALRKAGFAAWLRTPAQGFSYHIHAVAIGDREMSPSAKDQEGDYFAGRNGLANNGADTDPPRPIPFWANQYRP